MACIFCGSTTHNYRNCPISYTKNVTFKKEFFGQAPNVFVGKHGYPNIRVGFLGTEQYEQHDAPQHWAAQNTPMQSIVEKRSALVNSYVHANIKGKLLDVTQHVSIAKRPVDVEVNLKKKPSFKLTTHAHAAPHGPNVQLKKAEITENVPVDTRVEKVLDATDLKAADAITKLTKKGFDTYFLTKAFSTGSFGLPTERKLVPTRWSITGVDDLASKHTIAEIKQYKESDCFAYFGGHYGNYYIILFFDDVWQYELYEQYHGNKEAQHWTDYEPYKGRKNYAKDTAGGYYAARLGIVKNLAAAKRQAAVLAIRIITDEYTTPLGVWVVREAVKKTLATKPMQFADKTLMLAYAKQLLQRKFGYDVQPFLKKSLLLKAVCGQQKLSHYK